MRSPPGARDDSARVYCHLGAITNLAIAVGSSCLFTRPLATRADESGVIDAFALAEEIRLSIDFYLAQPEIRPVREIVLSGPRASVDGLTEQLAAATGLEVLAAEPLGSYDRASLPGGRGSPPPHRRARPVPGSGGVRPVNLLPARYRPRTGGGADSKNAYIALGVLGLLVLAVFGYVMTANKVSSKNSEIAAARQQIAAAADAGRDAGRLRRLRRRQGGAPLRGQDARHGAGSTGSGSSASSPTSFPRASG